MVGPIPLESFKKMGWKKIFEAMPFFLLFLVCSAKLDKLCSKSFSYHFKFYNFMFMHQISTQVVCVNGKSPWSQFILKSIWVLSHWVCLLLVEKSRGSFPGGVYLAHIIIFISWVGWVTVSS